MKNVCRAENRWTRMDVNLQRQIDALMSAMRIKNLGKLADEADIGRSRFYECYNCPSKFRLVDLRKLTILFEANGLSLDMSCGEGAGT